MEFASALPSQAFVSSFSAEFVDGKVVATVKEKQAAEAQFRAAVRNGQQAALLQQSKTSFDMKLGNLAAGERVTVSLTVIMTLATLSDGSGHIRVVLPLPFADTAFKNSVAPLTRASKGEDSAAVALPALIECAEPGSAVAAPGAPGGPFFSLRMTIACASPITSITAPAIEPHVQIVSVTSDPRFADTALDAAHSDHPDRHRVVSMQALQAPTRDIELVIAQQHPYSLAANVEIDGRTRTAASAVSIRLPPLNELTDSADGLPLELIFIADVSGTCPGVVLLFCFPFELTRDVATLAHGYTVFADAAPAP